MNILLASPEEWSETPLVNVVNHRGDQLSQWHDVETQPPVDSIQVVAIDLVSNYALGLDFFKKVRATPAFHHCYLLALSLESSADLLKQLYELGFDNVLTAEQLAHETLDTQLCFIERQVQIRNRLQESEKIAIKSYSEISQQRNDTHNTLNHLRIGACMINDFGNLTFLNHMAQEIFEWDNITYFSRPWQEVLSFKPADMDELAKSIIDTYDKRFSHSFNLRTAGGRHYWLDVEVIANPSSPTCKTLLFYDMSEVHDLRRLLDDKARFHDLVGKSKAMLEVYQLIQDIANVSMTTLIEGDTGTGKELVARAIHSSGARKSEQFIAVNCAGLTDSLLTSQLFGHKRGAFTGAVDDHKGVFEAAHGGTLFLDEIGDISMNMQTTLLRVLQEREVTRVGDTKVRKVDVHLIAATNRNLLHEVEKGNFRSDLLYRIRVARIYTPALRERLEDIPLLVSALLTKKRAAMGKDVQSISDPALHVLLDYPWPGNVRELENVMEYAVLRCRNETINVKDLPPELTDPAGLRNGIGSLQASNPRQQILDALEQTLGSRIKAAKILGVSRATFYRRLTKYKINPADYSS